MEAKIPATKQVLFMYVPFLIFYKNNSQILHTEWMLHSLLTTILKKGGDGKKNEGVMIVMNKGIKKLSVGWN